MSESIEQKIYHLLRFYGLLLKNWEIFQFHKISRTLFLMSPNALSCTNLAFNNSFFVKSERLFFLHESLFDAFSFFF